MSLSMLTQKSMSLFTAVGGWRTVAEGVASRVMFLVAYLVTGQVWTSALIAVGGVAVIGVIRGCTDRKYWSAVIGLGIVGASALLAGTTGQAANFYLPVVLTQVTGGVVFLMSMLARWPVVGLAVGTARGDRFGWRRDRAQLRRYQACTAVFLAKFVLATAILVPLYLIGELLPLGIAATLLGGAPSMAVCTCFCWRILRTRAEVATVGAR